jgi:hypothetical protein
MLARLDGAVAHKDADDEDLQRIETNDALEGEELEHDLMWCELAFLELVEAEAGEDGENGRGYLDDLKPDMCESGLVRGAAVGADSEGDGGGDPDNDSDGEVLEDHVPCSLGDLSVDLTGKQ